MDKTLLARIAALPNMSLSELKALWRDVYEDEPPSGHKSYIVRGLAYRTCLWSRSANRKPD